VADANSQVMDLVRAEIQKNPDISNQELLEKAKAVDKSIGKLSARQFNARYPLQVKRAMKPATKKTRPAASRRQKAPGAAPGRAKGAASARDQGQGQGRDKVRTIMLELARDVANAQGKGDVVDVIMGIDRYVDRVIKAAS
jgi:hypothetical protein